MVMTCCLTPAIKLDSFTAQLQLADQLTLIVYEDMKHVQQCRAGEQIYRRPFLTLLDLQGLQSVTYKGTQCTWRGPQERCLYLLRTNLL